MSAEQPFPGNCDFSVCVENCLVERETPNKQTNKQTKWSSQELLDQSQPIENLTQFTTLFGEVISGMFKESWCLFLRVGNSKTMTRDPWATNQFKSINTFEQSYDYYH